MFHMDPNNTTFGPDKLQCVRGLDKLDATLVSAPI